MTCRMTYPCDWRGLTCVRNTAAFKGWRLVHAFFPSKALKSSWLLPAPDPDATGAAAPGVVVVVFAGPAPSPGLPLAPLAPISPTLPLPLLACLGMSRSPPVVPAPAGFVPSAPRTCRPIALISTGVSSTRIESFDMRILPASCECVLRIRSGSRGVWEGDARRQTRARRRPRLTRGTSGRRARKQTWQTLAARSLPPSRA